MNKHLKIAQYITNILENRFRVLGFKFGLDPVLGMFPGRGDIVTAGLSFYIVWIAIQMKAPQEVVSKMLENIVMVFVIGIIPVLGDLSDFVFKSNSRNLRLLEEYATRNVIDAEII